MTGPQVRQALPVLQEWHLPVSAAQGAGLQVVFSVALLMGRPTVTLSTGGARLEVRPTAAELHRMADLFQSVARAADLYHVGPA